MEFEIQSESNEGLIQKLQEHGVIKNEAIATVMKQTDRKLYFRTSRPYIDHPESIGYSETMPAPHIHAYALENLFNFINHDSKVLDISSGSGYLTVCFARLIKANAAKNFTTPTGIVVGLEKHPKLVEYSIESINLDDESLIADGIVKIIQSDGTKGCEQFGPYDVIYVDDTAIEMPVEIIKQLKINGRMLCSVGTRSGSHIMKQYDRINNEEVVKRLLKGET